MVEICLRLNVVVAAVILFITVSNGSAVIAACNLCGVNGIQLNSGSFM